MAAWPENEVHIALQINKKNLKTSASAETTTYFTKRLHIFVKRIKINTWHVQACAFHTLRKAGGRFPNPIFKNKLGNDDWCSLEFGKYVTHVHDVNKSYTAMLAS